jgi:hypothetical protein
MRYPIILESDDETNFEILGKMSGTIPNWLRKSTILFSPDRSLILHLAFRKTTTRKRTFREKKSTDHDFAKIIIITMNIRLQIGLPPFTSSFIG